MPFMTARPKRYIVPKKVADALGVESKVLAKSDPEVSPEDKAKITARLEGLDYHPSATMARFHASDAFVRGVRGPVRGGKSTAMCQEILRRAREQKPGPDGIRHTRFVVVRNTYGELKDTTVKTWTDWVPENWFGKFNRSQGEMRHPIKIRDIDCEVLFRALDKPEDVRKLLSLEVTGAWVNEAREVPREIIDTLGDRVGQYPAAKDGGCTWRGLFLDSNPPDEDHWWAELEPNPPQGWEFFIQPPGMIEKDGKWVQNPSAENVQNLNEANYYETRAAGKRVDYIKVYYGNQFGFVTEGKPVFPEYSDIVHAAKADIPFEPNRPVYIGIGLALHSGALFGQRLGDGKWVFIDEMMQEYGGAVHFAMQLAAKMAADYPQGTQFKVFTLRPDDYIGSDAETIQILRGRGIVASPCRINDETLRREAVAGALSRLVNGEPGLLVSPRCKVTRKALAGGYSYARIQGKEERYHDNPAKNRYAPLAEAAQYMLVGGGEATFVFRSPKPKKLTYPQMGIV